jgi:hypothetical protein
MWISGGGGRRRACICLTGMWFLRKEGGGDEVSVRLDLIKKPPLNDQKSASGACFLLFVLPFFSFRSFSHQRLLVIYCSIPALYDSTSIALPHRIHSVEGAHSSSKSFLREKRKGRGARRTNWASKQPRAGGQNA